ncbi:MAG: class I SAM-dependent methyltransferase [Saprospiraceae bacterium]|nr:class I SAM-dependent methyltransferase [Saprospiraceae bacterium]
MSHCRFCKAELKEELIDLGSAPLSNALLTKDNLSESEIWYPLRVMICGNCFMVQTEDYSGREHIFHDQYAYFSSYSSTWLNHSKSYCQMMQNRFGLGSDQLVLEVASNDGYLLQYFKESGIPVLGVEPTANTAQVALDKGIATVVDFFGTKLAQQLKNERRIPNLIVGNNVLAHVPDVLDFVTGLKILLHPEGVITVEFPHLLKLIQFNQFDTIYHEHFSYFSFHIVKRIFESIGLRIFDVDELDTHGGSLRIYATHQENSSHLTSENVDKMIRKESAFGIESMDTYAHFQNKVNSIKNRFNQFLIDAKIKGKSVIAYGAAAKGNTLLNYCGVRKDLVQFIVDASPHKQGKFTPGMHIPILDEKHIRDLKPDYVVVLPWNIKDEIEEQLFYIRRWGGKLVVAIPQLEVF